MSDSTSAQPSQGDRVPFCRSNGRFYASHIERGAAHGRRAMGRVSLALVAVAAYAVVTLLLYALVVRWP